MLGLYDCGRKDIYHFDSIYPDGPFMSTADETTFYRKSLLPPLLLLLLWGCTEAPVVRVGDVREPMHPEDSPRLFSTHIYLSKNI